MARTIIEQGIDQFHAHCDQCGCVFNYERADVRHDFVHSRDYVSCPSCGHALSHFGVSGTRWWPMKIAGSKRGDWLRQSESKV